MNDKTFTEDEVRAALFEFYSEADEDQIEPEDAEGALEELGVEHARERIEWMNLSWFCLLDLTALANVEFHEDTCDHCGAKQYYGEPEDWILFQGALDDEAMAHLEVSVLGTASDVTLCDDCLAEFRQFVDF